MGTRSVRELHRENLELSIDVRDLRERLRHEQARRELAEAAARAAWRTAKALAPGPIRRHDDDA